jgi:NADPH2:quinone reductase
MKAILMNTAGDAGVLQLKEISKPELPTAHHMRVKLVAAGLNPLDTKLRAKAVYYPDKLPAILGCDGAGIVEKTGSEVTRFKAGDAVYFCNGGIGDEPGNYAEYTTLHEEYCASPPANISLEDAAALPLAYLTTWEALVDRVNLQAGQTILIHAAAGGVGHLAVQFAHQLGARIAVTAGDIKKSGLAHAFGAEKLILYKEQDFVQETLNWTSELARSPHPNPDETTSHSTRLSKDDSQVAGYLPEGEGTNERLREFHNKWAGVDVVFDTVGGETFLRSLHAVRAKGKIVSLLSTPLSLADTQLARLRNLSICYELMLAPQLMKLHEERVRQRKLLEHCTRQVEAGELGVLVTHRYPLAQAADAHRLLEAGGITGKIILTMD